MSKEILSFGYGELDEYDPSHNGIDWKAKFAGEVALAGMDMPPPVWVESSEGVKQQLNQENYFIWINETSDELDCLQVMDVTDGGVWTFFRDDLGSDEYDKLVESTAHAATFIHTVYPPRMVQNLFEEKEFEDLEGFDGFGEV